jgi:hypothetical protein
LTSAPLAGSPGAGHRCSSGVVTSSVDLNKTSIVAPLAERRWSVLGPVRFGGPDRCLTEPGAVPAARRRAAVGIVPRLPIVGPSIGLQPCRNSSTIVSMVAAAAGVGMFKGDGGRPQRDALGPAWCPAHGAAGDLARPRQASPAGGRPGREAGGRAAPGASRALRLGVRPSAAGTMTAPLRLAGGLSRQRSGGGDSDGDAGRPTLRPSLPASGVCSDPFPSPNLRGRNRRDNPPQRRPVPVGSSARSSTALSADRTVEATRSWLKPLSRCPARTAHRARPYPARG